MKIKVALLDKDKEYLDRLTGVFNTKYADKLEVYSFTDEKNAIESVKEYRIDVLIAEEDFNIDKSEFKRNCGLAYFTGTPGIELIKDEIAICKYQRVDVIFKQILGVYSDMAANVATISGENDKSSVVIFTSPCGGVGTSTVAAACAIAHGLQLVVLETEMIQLILLQYTMETMLIIPSIFQQRISQETRTVMSIMVTHLHLQNLL